MAIRARCRRTVPLSRRWKPLAAVLLLLSLGCQGEASNTGETHVAYLDDNSYGGLRGRAIGVNVKGKDVYLEDFRGRFLWVDYAAPWCGPCAPQSRYISALEKSLGKDVAFLTILTSDHKPFTDATRGTAKMWARDFALDPNRVVAGDRTTAVRKIPQHFLFSPAGQTLYRHTGLLPADHIKTALSKSKGKWLRERNTYEGGL